MRDSTGMSVRADSVHGTNNAHRLCLWILMFHIRISDLTASIEWGTRWRSGLESRVWFPMVSLEFFVDIILPASSRLSLKQKWVPGAFPGGKGCRCVRLTTLPPSCADCLEIREPQPLLESSGHVQACNMFALPLNLWSRILLEKLTFLQLV